jgi:hypothetical protein
MLPQPCVIGQIAGCCRVLSTPPTIEETDIAFE